MFVRFYNKLRLRLRTCNLLDLAAALKFQDLETKKLDFKKIISLRNHNVEISIIFYPGPVILSG